MFATPRTDQVGIKTIDKSPQKISPAPAAAAATLALVLLLSLAPLPHAAAVSTHTWRIELASVLFLLGAAAVSGVRFALGSTQSKNITLFIAIFTLWGMISGLWAMSLASVAHHTILWCEYALFFVLASEILRTRGRTFLLTVFACYAAVIGILTLTDYLTLPDFKQLEGTLRLRYSAYGELSIAILPVLWIAASYRLRAKSWLVALLPGALGWTAAMLSLSKGVFIAGIVGFAFAFGAGLILGRDLPRRRLFATAAIWLALTVAVQLGSSLVAPIPATVDYITGKADPTRETTAARVFIWRTTLPLVKAHWLAGVGADNYGLVANVGRAAFRSAHPTDPPDEPISDFRFERAHDEPLQVLVELGIPGLLLFAAPFVLFVWFTVRSVIFRNERPSLFFWGACGGLVAFACSSMVSSFSFRIVPNGIAFFLVLAFAVHELVRADRRSRQKGPILNIPTPAVAAVLVLAIAILVSKAVAEFEFSAGDANSDRSTAAAEFSRAGLLDPDYAAAHYRLSSIAFENQDYRAAATELQRAIQNGMGVVLSYSSLADCYARAGETDAEFNTFEEALRIYPRSVFLHVRYAIELQKSSRMDAAESQLEAARDIDTKQTNGWYSLITRGSVRTFYDAQTNDDMAMPADLKPQIAVLQFLDKDPEQ